MPGRNDPVISYHWLLLNLDIFNDNLTGFQIYPTLKSRNAGCSLVIGIVTTDDSHRITRARGHIQEQAGVICRCNTRHSHDRFTGKRLVVDILENIIIDTATCNLEQVLLVEVGGYIHIPIHHERTVSGQLVIADIASPAGKDRIYVMIRGQSNGCTSINRCSV